MTFVVFASPFPPYPKLGCGLVYPGIHAHNFGHRGNGGTMFQIAMCCLIMATNRGVKHDVASQVQWYYGLENTFAIRAAS